MPFHRATYKPMHPLRISNFEVSLNYQFSPWLTAVERREKRPSSTANFAHWGGGRNSVTLAKPCEKVIPRTQKESYSLYYITFSAEIWIHTKTIIVTRNIGGRPQA